MRWFHKYAVNVSIEGLVSNLVHHVGHHRFQSDGRRSRLRTLPVFLLFVIAVAAYAEAPIWVQWLPVSSPATNILYRMVPMIGGPISVRRPPKETAPALARLGSAGPSDADVIKITAREYEAQLDFTNAEDRWKQLDSVSTDHVASQIELADYYHRRLQPDRELQALNTADSRLPAIGDPLGSESQQRSWQLHERIQQLIQAQAMPAAAAAQDYETWIAKYPKSQELQRRYFDLLTRNGMLARADQELARYERDFPNDRIFPVHARTQLASKRGSPGGALAVYDAAYDPLWPQELLDGYFQQLTDSHKLFDFYQNARRSATARPLDLGPATRLFHYYRKQADLSAARRELAEYRLRKEGAKASWTPAELRTLGTLSASVDDYEEAIRYAYALYSLPRVDSGSAEAALAQIIGVLLKAPEQPIRFGRGDLSFYRDIATMDSSPGFLNGILSLIFNSQYPDAQFRSQETKSRAYFHRAEAADLYKLLSDRFPASTRRSELLSRIIESYTLYGEDEAIIRQGTAFISDFPDAPQRTRVALQVADAYARRRQINDELAIYNRLLGELSAKSNRVPIGSGPPRSPEYAQVLQRYVARLGQLNRINDALALYRAEIDRNPNDPGLYDQLASFLGANQRSGEIEQLYRRAMQRFQDATWRHKLARFYLRNRMANELRTLSREVVDTFAGSDVESYMSDVVADATLERRLQVDINLYALQRFPHDLRFVHNLISLYSTPQTADAAALMRLLGEHWYEDEAIRRMYFERLAATGSLASSVQAAATLLPPQSAGSWPDALNANPAVTRFIGEAAAWQSHFETASSIMRAVAAAYPADPLFATRASEVYRSLAAYDDSYVSVATSIAEDLSRSDPRNVQRLTRIGEIYADREMFGPATSAWTRIPTVEPGKPDGYLETATLFWDYLRPAEALSWLQRGRVQLKNSSLWAYEAGAIRESQGQRQQAVTEYMRGALSAHSNAARARLLRLATRQDYKTLIDDQTKRRTDTAPADQSVLELRVSVLRAQKRDSELEPLLAQTVDRTLSREILSYVRRVADESNMSPLQERVIRREAQLETDPQEQLRLRLELAHFMEAGGDLAAAQAQIESVYQSNSLVSGVIRATADYYWRHDKPRAIRVLAEAADHAHPSLKKQYLMETVRKAIEAKQFADAIQSADQLLRIDPIDGQSVALMGDALAAAGRQNELQQLYLAKISEIQQSKLAAADKTDRIAAMRRGLIPVLVRDGKFREAIDQFIEVINRFADDEAVLSEAGRLASQHDLRGTLIDYYARTVENSPRDPRWAIILARLQTQFENYPAAIDAYTKAMAARPERQDLAIARADLEERTFRFADAIATYNRLYELSHRAPIWLEHVARLQARLGQNREAVASLQRAYIENRPESSREYGKVAVILDELGMADVAADFIRQQMAVASSQPSWSSAHASIMIKARRYDEALQPIVDQRNLAAGELGRAVSRYLTPEERQDFATRLTQRKQAAGAQQLPAMIEIANAARLYDLEVAWRIEQSAQTNPQPGRAFFGNSSFATLQEQRMRFVELAHQLEDLAAKSPVDSRLDPLLSAKRAYQAIGDSAAELQLFSAHPELQVNDRQRYYQLLAGQRPDQLLSFASSPAAGNSNLLATQMLINAGDQVRAMQAIPRQGRNMLWGNAYMGLTGMYFGSNAPEVHAAFEHILGSPLIQDRVGKPVDRTSQLAGAIWFYYGQRYAEYLRDIGQPQRADDYLWSEVESRSGDPTAYLELARYYQKSGESDRAVVEFRHALELDGKRSDVHSEFALVLWDAGGRNEALAEWKIALEQVGKQPNAGIAARIIQDIRSRQQEAALHAEMNTVMLAAARALQVWQLPPLLQAAFEKSTDDKWLLDIVQASRAPGQLLTILAGTAVRGTWLSPQQEKVVFEAGVNLLATSTGQNRAQYQQMRQQYLDYLLDHNDSVTARKILDSFSEAERHFVFVQRFELRLAAVENKLPDLLSRYESDPSQAPDDSTLQETAAELVSLGLSEASRQVFEFLYTRQIENARTPAAFLALAEIRVKQGQTDQAVELLKRLNRISGQPFEHLLASARVFFANGHPQEAQEFIKLRVQAVPWDDEARLELARVEVAVNQKAAAAADLQKIVNSRLSPYDIRTEAAREQGRNGFTPAASSGSREMDLLSNRIPLTPAGADAPYFFAAKLVAAELNTDPAMRLRLLLGAIAERPDDRDVRRKLFQAALDSRQYHVAIAANRRFGFEDQTDPALTAGMAEAHQQIGDFAEALRLFRIAAASEKDSVRRQALEEKAKQAQAANERLLENERRRPIMRADVDQPNPVRRRLP